VSSRLVSRLRVAGEGLGDFGISGDLRSLSIWISATALRVRRVVVLLFGGIAEMNERQSGVPVLGLIDLERQGGVFVLIINSRTGGAANRTLGCTLLGRARGGCASNLTSFCHFRRGIISRLAGHCLSAVTMKRGKSKQFLPETLKIDSILRLLVGFYGAFRLLLLQECRLHIRCSIAFPAFPAFSFKMIAVADPMPFPLRRQP
jgi:hypothetical protein